jgi:hypothetical protein
MLTKFSKHAFKRLAQRTKLSVETIVDILEHKIYINLGLMPGFNKGYLFFYSSADEDYFVAIQDLLNGTVLTILPEDFHINSEKRITDNDRQKVKKMYLDYLVKKNEIPKSFGNKSSRVFVSTQYLDKNGQQRSKQIFELKILNNNYGSSISEIIKNQMLYKDLFERTKIFGIENKNIFSIAFRQGKASQQPILIDVNESDDE